MIDDERIIEGKIYDAAKAGDPHAMIAYALIQISSTIHAMTDEALPVAIYFTDETEAKVKIQGGE